MEHLALDEKHPLAAEETAPFFEKRAKDFAEEVERRDRRCAWLVQGRVAVFLLMLVFIGLGAFGYGPQAILFSLAGGLAVGFCVLVHWHGREQFARTAARHLREIHEEALARRRRDWKRLPHSAAPVDGGADLAGADSRQAALVGSLVKDLDLTGPRSVFHFVCQAHTVWGRATVRDWLFFPAAPASVAARQQAAAELAPLANFRQRLAVFGRLAAESEREGDARRLISWAEDKPWLLVRPGVLWTSRVLPAVTLLLLAAWSFGYVPGSLVALFGLVNLVFTFIFAGRIHAVFAEVSSQHGEVKRYAEMLDIAARGPRESSELFRLHDLLTAGGHIAADRLHALANLANLANLRYSPLLYFVLQTIGLWDFHVLAALERWRLQNGKHVADWLRSLGELEALASWAAVAHENPDWVFPDVSDRHEAFEAQSLAHPLLPTDRSVANDVTVGPPGTFLLVTGSNMSGKSTLLRSIGVNALLAQAGAPVCAARLAMPPLRVATSMRIQDSLEDGVSFFMAELKRLKQIVDLGRAEGASEPRLLYLLDEILQGTNTAERQIAVRQVLAHLLEEGAIGAVSSHDLALADHPSLVEACRPVHFRETLHSSPDGPPMTFDYRLRPGIATTTNALKLLALVGLAE